VELANKNETMSFLLRSNQRKSQLDRGGVGALSRLSPRTAPSNIRPSGIGGQLQIQRPVQQQKQQQSHQQQQQQRVQGVISMAEGE
jgi:hypothetical protein